MKPLVARPLLYAKLKELENVRFEMYLPRFILLF